MIRGWFCWLLKHDWSRFTFKGSNYKFCVHCNECWLIDE